VIVTSTGSLPNMGCLAWTLVVVCSWRTYWRELGVEREAEKELGPEEEWSWRWFWGERLEEVEE
jgi:hypothetical protein